MNSIELRRQLKSQGYRQWRMLRSNEVRELPLLLRNEETVKKVIYGNYEGGWAMMAATDQRIIFVDRKLFRCKVQYIAYRNIFSFDYSSGFFYGHIEIHARGAKILLKSVRRSYLTYFCQYLDQMVEEPHKKE